MILNALANVGTFVVKTAYAAMLLYLGVRSYAFLVNLGW